VSDGKAPSERSDHGLESPTVLGPPLPRPGDDRFLSHLAAAGDLVAANRYREAEVEVLRALSGLPADLRALNLLALVRFKLGRLEEAHATYKEIALAVPNDATARRNLGLLSLKLDRLEEAIPELEMAARLLPGDTRAWSHLGYAYAKKGEVVAAAAAFRRAGQDVLASELENAATSRRPPSGPTPQPPLPAAGATEPAAVPPPPTLTTAAPAPTVAVPSPSVVQPPPPPAPAPEPEPPMSEPTVLATAPPAVTRAPAPAPAPAPAAAPAPAPAATLVAPRSPEIEPVPLVAFVLSRLGLAAAPPAPRDQALRLTVDDEVHLRGDAMLAGSSVHCEPAFRRTQGRRSAVPLGSGASAFFRVVGPGEVWVAGHAGRWQALSLDDDVLYVREDRVLAFDGSVSWEAGAIPGEGLRMIQFRGRGCVVLQLDAPPAAVKVADERPVLISSERLLGWVGRLVAHKQRAAAPTPFQLACQGDGVVLFELQGPTKGP
jgi:uncharacterized protein (AIM24 family)